MENELARWLLQEGGWIGAFLIGMLLAVAALAGAVIVLWRDGRKKDLALRQEIDARFEASQARVLELLQRSQETQEAAVACMARLEVSIAQFQRTQESQGEAIQALCMQMVRIEERVRSD